MGKHAGQGGVAARVAGLVLPALLSACTMLGPDYQEPDTAWLRAWDAGLHGLSGEGDDVALQAWWRLFRDPVLDRLVQEAASGNRDLRLAALRIFESRALAGIAGAGLYPQVQQVSGAVDYVAALGKDAGPSDYLGYQAALTVGWELDFWGRFRRAIESADAAFFAAVENERAVQVLIHAEVVDRYLAYRVLQERIRIARHNAGIQKRSFQIATELYESGNTSELDLQQARTQYLSTLAAIPQLELSLRQTGNALAVLLGRVPGDLPELETAADYRLPMIDGPRIAEAPTRLLLRRPDVRAAAWRVAAQSAQIGVAQADLYPAVSLLGTLGWAGSSLAGVPGSGRFTLGPGLRWNIFDHGAIRNNVRLQDARLQQAIEQYQNTVLQAVREVDNAAVAVVKTREQAALLERTVASARRALEIANTRYREGYSDFQRVLDAQRALFAEADRRVVNQGAHLAAVIQLYKGLGGGWSPRGTGELLPAQLRGTMKERTDWGGLLDAPLPSVPPRPPTPKEETDE
jgi:NodT family efflux transporter outer membrane factor (OMF) lipoprotein